MLRTAQQEKSGITITYITVGIFLFSIQAMMLNNSMHAIAYAYTARDISNDFSSERKMVVYATANLLM
jgi:hypothetical protein